MNLSYRQQEHLCINNTNNQTSLSHEKAYLFVKITWVFYLARGFPGKAKLFDKN